MGSILIQSTEGKIFTIKRKIAMMIEPVNAVVTLGVNITEPIKIPNANTIMLEHIINLLRVINDKEKVHKYLNALNKDEVITMVQLSNAMSMDVLLDHTSTYIASWFVGRTTKECYEEFGMELPTEEEEQQCEKENPWLTDLKF